MSPLKLNGESRGTKLSYFGFVILFHLATYFVGSTIIILWIW